MEKNGAPTADEVLSRAEELIEKGELAEAQKLLDEIEEKSGRKYFVQSKIFAQKGWHKEQRVQLLYAVGAEPGNVEYRIALENLTELQSKTLTDEDYLARAEKHLDAGELTSAQNNLDYIKTKSGRKCYIQSKIYKQKKWYNEQRKQLKKAIEFEPENEEYKRDLAELEEFKKTDEYKSFRNEMRKEQMGNTFGNACGECCCTGALELCCWGICEGLGNC